MTPKEKANLLYNKMVVDFGIDHWQIKQCALVAVDEILSMGIMSESGDWNMAKEFWEEVKQEIEKL
jgi:hypothetical protein